MVFELLVADDGGGLTDVALRRHRGDHLLRGKGGCRRLAKLLPAVVKDDGTAALVSYDLAEWLASVVLRPDAAAADGFFYKYVLGYERMGVALDRVLSKIKDDSPRHPGVLRAELRRAGDVDFDKGGNGTEVYVMGVADLYEVATAFPTGAGIDGLYDWLGLWKLSDLQTANEDLSLYGDLVCPLGLRFDPDVALVQDGPFDKLAMAITKSLSQEEASDYTGLTKEEAAVELATWVRYALPCPAELCEYGGTRAASLIALRRLLRESSGGQALLITPANVATVIQHHEAAKLVIGNNVGGLVALNMVIELLRLSLRPTEWTDTTCMDGLGNTLATRPRRSTRLPRR